jgi:hypothetical protein
MGNRPTPLLQVKNGGLYDAQYIDEISVNDQRVNCSMLS